MASPKIYIYTNKLFGLCTPFFGALGGIAHHLHTHHHLLHIPTFFQNFSTHFLTSFIRTGTNGLTTQSKGRYRIYPPPPPSLLLVLLWVSRHSCRIQYVCGTTYANYRLAYIAIMMANELTCTMWFTFAQMLRYDVWCNASEVLAEACRKAIKYVVNGTER
jgi:hypothetical protein